MLELWKPIKVKKENSSNIEGPVIFDPLGYQYRNAFRPFVIFYDDQEDCYWYLKAKGLYIYKDGEEKRRKIHKYVINNKEIETEIPVLPDPESALFSKASLVDCSQIFKCDRRLLETLVENDETLRNTKYLSKAYQADILEKMRDLIMEVPPLISILEIKVSERNKTYAESLYLHEEIFYDNNEDYDGQQLENFNDFDSSKDGNFYHKERYQNGIQFCEMFLKEYFPEELDEFRNLQDLKKSSTLDNEEDSKLEM